jgi:hypothetical protein
MRYVSQTTGFFGTLTRSVYVGEVTQEDGFLPFPYCAIWWYSWHYFRIEVQNLIENFFSKLKHFRGIAICSDRLSRNFQATIHFVAVLVWLN